MARILKKEVRGKFRHAFRHHMKMPFIRQVREAFTATSAVDTLISDFKPTEMRKHNFLISKPSNL